MYLKGSPSIDFNFFFLLATGGFSLRMDGRYVSLRDLDLSLSFTNGSHLVPLKPQCKYVKRSLVFLPTAGEFQVHLSMFLRKWTAHR